MRRIAIVARLLSKPVVLTLANPKGGAVYVQAWANTVERRSGGSIRIRISNHWRAAETGYEKSRSRTSAAARPSWRSWPRAPTTRSG